MNYQNTSNASYLRKATHIGFRQQIPPRDSHDVPGGIVLWKAVGKAVIFLFPLFLVVSLFLSSAINDIEAALSNIDNQRDQLMDKNIELLVERATLYSPERVGKLAAEKLSLYAAAPGQIEHLN